jgi:hypothetical protein
MRFLELQSEVKKIYLFKLKIMIKNRARNQRGLNPLYYTNISTLYIMMSDYLLIIFLANRCRIKNKGRYEIAFASAPNLSDSINNKL